jgi:repressor LexA
MTPSPRNPATKATRSTTSTKASKATKAGRAAKATRSAKATSPNKAARAAKGARSAGQGDPEVAKELTDRQRDILAVISAEVSEHGYPPSVREIGEAVGLTSPSTVHAHLNTLEKLGYLRRDPSKPRAIEVRYDPNSGSAVERRPVRHVPLVGDVAAGTGVLAQQEVDETMPVPADLCGDGELFMLRVRGESMIDDGIFDRDYVVVRAQPDASNGEIVVAGIPGEEATVKRLQKDGAQVTLMPGNESMEPMTFPAEDVQVFGKVVTVIRQI